MIKTQITILLIIASICLLTAAFICHHHLKQACTCNRQESLAELQEEWRNCPTCYGEGFCPIHDFVGVKTLKNNKDGRDNTVMGTGAELQQPYDRLTTLGHHNTLIGYNAGADLTDESYIVIIGDNIRSLDHSQKDVMFLGDNIAIGKMLFGKPIQLQELILRERGAKL